MTERPLNLAATESGEFFTVRDLGRMSYSKAYALQKRLQGEVIAQRASAAGDQHGVLLLVEHDPPVITVSRRKTARQHLIADAATLASAGIEVAETDRGGDITYHGPGQLVVYPILDLNRLGLRLHGYMRLLEGVVINTLRGFGMNGFRDESATGVWVHPKQADADLAGTSCPAGAASAAKICALGVRVSRWVTMHGLALNVATDLEHFRFIVPCGLADRGVTSMLKELTDCPSIADVKEGIVREFDRSIREQVASSVTLSDPIDSA